MQKQNIRNVTVTAIMGAIGFILMVLGFPISFLIPPFIKFDFSELPALITAFALGPWWGVLVCLIKNILHLPLSDTAYIGEASNFILGAIFVCISGYVYKINKNRKSALIGTIIGALTMAVISVVTNYFIVYPAFAAVGVIGAPNPMQVILSMYQAILPSVENLFEALVIFNLPFNLAKGLIDAAICFAIYKKISPILKYSKNNS